MPGGIAPPARTGPKSPPQKKKKDKIHYIPRKNLLAKNRHCSNLQPTFSSFFLLSKCQTPDYKIRVVGEYTKANDRIKVQCKTCNHTWNAIPASLRLGVGCPKCAGVLQLTHDQFVARLRVLQPDLIPLTEYINTKEKVVVKCKVCGYVWSTREFDTLQS